ncbi:alpha/beta hydrolase [Lactobacillus mellis]|uniref:alpha/beta hydrolase n=1 Tax=Bombilactobacillus mellis TaxID=1218508 RepID=UPI001580E760|nr:alpha/beta hydrolase [Bombilactobacillus mellis]MCT6840763.1 alpha/beta hydrolase [Bombilactobacillus mellis]MCX0279529.1 alpha/beta hydrolase [Bombilactobacillus mellis]NUG39729.1 alpha/beta hydrolase [Bombilactobacillus mellis]
MKTKTWINIIIGIMLLLTIPAYQTMQASVNSERVWHNSRVSPVIFIPGSSANQDRFDNLFQQMHLGKRKLKRSVLKITVQKNDKIKTSGSIAARDQEPFIVIAFQNNQDGYTNISQQTRWLKIAMNYLTNNYNFNNFSAIGHSNGGLIWTWYLEKYFNRNDLTINSLMTVGTPYNSLESNIKNETAIFRQLYRNKENLPANLIVYAIAGTKNYQDDGIVPYQSVEAGKYIYQKQVKKYTQITVTGENSSHGSLLDNPQVTRLVQENIMDNRKTAP